jgi:hypothetical protein
MSIARKRLVKDLNIHTVLEHELRAAGLCVLMKSFSTISIFLTILYCLVILGTHLSAQHKLLVLRSPNFQAPNLADCVNAYAYSLASAM